MKLRLLFLILAIFSVTSYVYAGPCPLSFFISNQNQSDVRLKVASPVVFPTDEFNLALAKKHYKVMKPDEYEGTPINYKATEHEVSLAIFDDGQYRLSFKIKFYDLEGNVVDMVNEAYYSGIVLAEDTQFYSEVRKRFLFQDGNIEAQIDLRGTCTLVLDFKKPLYGVFSNIKFSNKNFSY